MKKLNLFLICSIGTTLSFNIIADGGALGLQLGPITFGLGGSSNGPIIGIGPSPDNGLPIAVPFVPGDCCGGCNSCGDCTSCGCNQCGTGDCNRTCCN